MVLSSGVLLSLVSLSKAASVMLGIYWREECFGFVFAFRVYGNETTVNQIGKGYYHFGFVFAFRVWE